MDVELISEHVSKSLFSRLSSKINVPVPCKKAFDCSLLLSINAGDTLSSTKTTWKIEPPTSIQLLDVNEKANCVSFMILGLCPVSDEQSIQKAVFSTSMDNMVEGIFK